MLLRARCLIKITNGIIKRYRRPTRTRARVGLRHHTLSLIVLGRTHIEERVEEVIVIG